jgi:ABC-type microcin C transport system duplicated ATPase subunit YejF
VRDLVARFPLRSGILNRVTREVHAVEKVSFDLWPGETLALVGSPAAVNQPPAGRCCGWWNAGRHHYL